mgnify:CR=1 FL=1
MGTRVEVQLPIIDEPSPRKVPSKPTKVTAPGARILVVEDDPDVRDTVCEMLQLGGFVTASVSSGEEALRTLSEQGSFRLVISDVIMPSMSGFDLAAAMKDKALDTPLVLISGYARRSDQTDEGRSSIPRITKPFSMAELLEFVQLHMV